jgi:hypothetical protein
MGLNSNGFHYCRWWFRERRSLNNNQLIDFQFLVRIGYCNWKRRLGVWYPKFQL